MDNSTAIQHIRLIINNVLNEVQPAQLFSRRITFDGKMLNILGDDYDLDQFDNIYVIGFGKASATMAAQLESILGNRIASGRVITVYEAPGECKRIHVYYGAHPVTDENGLAASLRILQTCREAGKNDLVIVLISGGGSALFEHLPPDITLADLQKLNKQMIWRGHSINEINAVRKSISLVKGGKLLNYIYPARSISLILSDVVGDHVTIIASGPTCADQSASGNPLEVLSAHHLLNMIPRSIRTRLNNVISEREIITEADED